HITTTLACGSIHTGRKQTPKHIISYIEREYRFLVLGINRRRGSARVWLGSMKFWKSLSMLMEETLPNWRDNFLSYKDLKKHLKLIYPKHQGRHNPKKRPRLESDGPDVNDAVVTKDLIDFVTLLEGEVDKFNRFFLDQEEEYVIKWKELQERVEKTKDSNEKLMSVGREIVDFHGEMVLLENYSALNYTGLVKIIKKYDKLSGALIRMPFIQKVLQQPFYSTDVLSTLVKECEAILDHVFSMNQPSTSDDRGDYDGHIPSEIQGRLLKVPKELAEIKHMESMYMKLTLSALRVLKEIRSGSSTVSMFSLPPLQSKALEEDWKKIPVLEQEAK
ncbi:SPX domain-containing protein, partial [Cephalotus follicularis]